MKAELRMHDAASQQEIKNQGRMQRVEPNIRNSVEGPKNLEIETDKLKSSLYNLGSQLKHNDAVNDRNSFQRSIRDTVADTDLISGSQLDSPGRLPRKFTRLNNEDMRSNEYTRKITEIDEQNFEQERPQYSLDQSLADNR